MSARKPRPDAASQVIRSFVERIERIEEEIKGLNTDKRDIYAEVKGYGLDVKALRAVVSMRRKDTAELLEHNAIVDLYLGALGMEVDLPDASRVHVHAREELPPHNPITGEIEPEAPKSPPASAATAPLVQPDFSERQATAKTLEQEPSEAEGSGEAQDRCESASPPISNIHSMPGVRINPHTRLAELEDDIPAALRRTGT